MHVSSSRVSALPSRKLLRTAALSTVVFLAAESVASACNGTMAAAGGTTTAPGGAMANGNGSAATNAVANAAGAMQFVQQLQQAQQARAMQAQALIRRARQQQFLMRMAAQRQVQARRDLRATARLARLTERAPPERERIRDERASIVRDTASESPGDPELTAASRLNNARNLLEHGNHQDARKWLTRLAAEFPGTRAAAEAAELLRDAV